MNEKTKESKFLDAINKYAEHKKAEITQEIETYKNQKIEQATEQGLQDAYDLIRADIARQKSDIISEAAREELKLKNELYQERMDIFEKVFRDAESRLKAFAGSAEYESFLRKSLDLTARYVDGEACTVYVAPFDENKSEMIRVVIPQADIITDNQILIGGVKTYCPAKHMLLDDTLDVRLSDQHAWFIEHSGLKAV